MPFPLDEKFIVETEKELGVTFPKKFVQKMLIDNGGDVSTEDDDWTLYPFFDKTDKKRISRTCNHIGLETKKAKEWTIFPDSGIAIGITKIKTRNNERPTQACRKPGAVIFKSFTNFTGLRQASHRYGQAK